MRGCRVAVPFLAFGSCAAGVRDADSVLLNSEGGNVNACRLHPGAEDIAVGGKVALVCNRMKRIDPARNDQPGEEVKWEWNPDELRR